MYSFWVTNNRWVGFCGKVVDRFHGLSQDKIEESDSYKGAISSSFDPAKVLLKMRIYHAERLRNFSCRRCENAGLFCKAEIKLNLT